AVDRIDPFRRKSNPSRTLFAMGVSNMCSSLIGGLTIIPGMIKSSTGIFSGARTAWVNFYNAIFLILFLVLGSNVINMIPVGVLAAVLVHIGYKLAGPHNWKHVASLGREQLAIFSVTVVTTLCSDLLLGIGAGMLTKVIVLLLYELRCDRAWKHEQLPLRIWHSLVTLFRDPILAVERRDDAVHVYFAGALNCFNSLKLRAALDQMPSDAKKVRLHFTSSVVLIDHSMNVYLNALRSEWAIRGWEIEMDGIECLKKCSQDDESLKYRPVSPLAA
ncbi:MAG TPA: SulP family inorganic anion transporter, partial [Candidatus Obscuribacterales bacterium]